MATLEAAPQAQHGNRQGAAALSELPTWVVIAAIYGGWCWVVWNFHSLPWWIAMPAAAWLVAWHNSFQHEAVHGHPSRYIWLNEVLAWPPLSLWLPYPVYRDSHRAHHATQALTDPDDDPESFYLNPEEWTAAGRSRRAILLANNTLLGRMLIGPWLATASFWRKQFAIAVAGDRRYVLVWLAHIALVSGMLYGLWRIFGISPLEYVLMFAWPGLALSLIRSFHEHKPAATRDGRTALVEAGPLMSLLFLNNNLHMVHHDQPGLPWFALRAAFRHDRENLLQRARGFYYPGGYLEIARRFAIRPKDLPFLER